MDKRSKSLKKIHVRDFHPKKFGTELLPKKSLIKKANLSKVFKKTAKIVIFDCVLLACDFVCLGCEQICKTYSLYRNAQKHYIKGKTISESIQIAINDGPGPSQPEYFEVCEDMASTTIPKKHIKQNTKTQPFFTDKPMLNGSHWININQICFVHLTTGNHNQEIFCCRKSHNIQHYDAKIGFCFTIRQGLQALSILKGIKIQMPGGCVFNPKEYTRKSKLPKKILSIFPLYPSTEKQNQYKQKRQPEEESISWFKKSKSRKEDLKKRKEEIEHYSSFRENTEDLIKASIDLNNQIINEAHCNGLKTGSLVLLKQITNIDLIASGSNFGNITFFNENQILEMNASILNKNEKSERTLLYLGTVEGKTSMGCKMKIQRWLKGKGIILANISPLIYDIVDNKDINNIS